MKKKKKEKTPLSQFRKEERSKPFLRYTPPAVQ